ncbi:hypothetical protein [uncultured Pseudoalteromonas sp.]|uniref:hypothetical protein n=1 Tax=uncultured Pseudoalteromonas sp. TaxID=114053 RepID=UPI00263889B7|nr:hypothetical protein [uncultured Pseudoalteromonas sp.]
MKLKLACLLLCPFVANAAEDKVAVYLNFEQAYLSNDVSLFAPLLSKNYTIKQTLHIPGLGSDTLPVTKAQLLEGMKQNPKPSSLPRSKAESVKVETISSNQFCANSQTLDQVVVAGKNYEEKELRKACFKHENNSYEAISHTIDVYYREL